MKGRMNVLFIAPTETMRPIVQKVAESYPNIDLTFMVGNEAMGKQIAQEAVSSSYDCIVSRGNTAALIRLAVSIPVIEIKVTPYDVLNSLSMAEQVPPVVAAVGYNSVIGGVASMKRFLPCHLETFGFDSTAELPEIFDRLRAMKIDTIVCDAITYVLAAEQGFCSYLLNSGEDAFRYAFDQVLQLQRCSEAVLEENQLLRRLGSLNSESETVVYSSSHALYYSSLVQQDSQLLALLQERLADFDTTDKFKIIKHFDGFLYRINARKVSIGSSIYYAYFISRKLPDSSVERKGIRYLSEAELRANMERNVFGISNVDKYYSTELNLALTRRNPVIIFGEVGVGKNHLAEMIYLKSNYTKNPFVIIDLPLLNKQAWVNLISKNDSPLCDNGNTLFIKNIDSLSTAQLSELLATLRESEAPSRNRLIISCSTRKEEEYAPQLAKTIFEFACLSIHMLPLSGQYGTIENSIFAMLNHFRKTELLPVGDPTPEALSQLLHYNWPQNFHQLIRVVHNVAIAAGSGPITREMVSDALTSEMYFTPGVTGHSANTALDLSRSLDEINADIIHILLEQNNGNQTATAKSLGISRTTMWRMLKNFSPNP